MCCVLYFRFIIDDTLITFLNLLQVPGGPAHNHLEPGDVLICLNGEVS